MSTIDLSEVFRGIDSLSEAAYSLARSMGNAGGQKVRDEAKIRAPVESGKLKDSIYVAFRDKQSTQTDVTYSVTWNSKKAPHGHLLEFGHWRYNKIVNGVPQKSLINGKSRGNGPQDHGGPGALDVPQWTPAHPFLRPAYEASLGTMQSIMIERGRQRLADLLNGGSNKAGEE